MSLFSLAELNSAIAGLVEQLNDRTMRDLGTTRRTLFEQFDQPSRTGRSATPSSRP